MSIPLPLMQAIAGAGHTIAPFPSGSDAAQAIPVMPTLFGGDGNGSWLNTPLPNNTAVNPGTAVAVAELQRQRTSYTPWINGMYDGNYTSVINVVPVDQALVPVTLERSESYAQALKQMFAAGVPIPNSVTVPTDTDAEMVFIQPEWTRTISPYTWRGRMYETWVTSKDGGGWHCFWGGRFVDVLGNKSGHWYDWWWGETGPPNDWTANGVAMDHNWGAQATSLPLVNTLISRYDLMNGIIKHPVQFMLAGVADVNKSAAVWPAQRWDGSSSIQLHQGARLRLPAGYTINPAWPWLTRLVATAARDYGLIFTDTASGLVLRMEPGGAAYINQHDAITNPSTIINAFPWADLQLMAVGNDSTYNILA
jgi:hypothetical protein